MKNDTLYINGRAYDEPYLKELKEQQVEGSLLTGNFTLWESSLMK